jgi:hypothetical protein
MVNPVQRGGQGITNVLTQALTPGVARARHHGQRGVARPRPCIPNRIADFIAYLLSEHGAASSIVCAG